MLAREHRLRLPRDIDRVFKRGRYGGAENLSIKALDTGGDNRAVVIVAKKVSKKAVIRNRIRRRLIEILAADWQRISPGCDIVVTVRADISGAPQAQLEKELTAALTKAGATK